MVIGLSLRVVRHHTKDKPKRALFARVSNMVVTMGVLGLILFFFLYEQINFFGAHFWWLFWTIGLIVWIVSVIRFARTKLAPASEEQLRQKERAKYLPKANA